MKHTPRFRLRTGRALLLTAPVISAALLINAAPAPEHAPASDDVVPEAVAVDVRSAADAAFDDVAADGNGRDETPDRSVDDVATENALRVLGPRVGRTSDAAALRSAFQAYYSYRDAHPDRVRKPYLFFVDLGLDNNTARGYVFDMDALRIVEGPFHVSHGRGSSATRNGVPTRFSNQPGSYASSLGLYLAQETYSFSGTSGGRRYSSVGLRMKGESGRFNDAARRRGIVAHGAPYVTAGGAGRSEGCPAMEPARAKRLLPMLANGGIVFIFSPGDSDWLANDRWVN